MNQFQTNQMESFNFRKVSNEYLHAGQESIRLKAKATNKNWVNLNLIAAVVPKPKKKSVKFLSIYLFHDILSIDFAVLCVLNAQTGSLRIDSIESVRTVNSTLKS